MKAKKVKAGDEIKSRDHNDLVDDTLELESKIDGVPKAKAVVSNDNTVAVKENADNYDLSTAGKYLLLKGDVEVKDFNDIHDVGVYSILAVSAENAPTGHIAGTLTVLKGQRDYIEQIVKNVDESIYYRLTTDPTYERWSKWQTIVTDITSKDESIDIKRNNGNGSSIDVAIKLSSSDSSIQIKKLSDGSYDLTVKK